MSDSLLPPTECAPSQPLDRILARLKQTEKGSEVESLSKGTLDEMSRLPIVLHAAKLKKPGA